MTDNYVCWKCGAGISHLPFPLGRMSKCESCKADLHVCKLCKFYDKTRANQCQEPVADPVADKQHSNFCGYFEAKIDAFQQNDSSPASAAQKELASLFGEPVDIPQGNNADKAKSELEKLFGDGSDADSNDTGNNK